MPDMELESLRGGRIFGRGVREKEGVFGRTPRTLLVTGLVTYIVKCFAGIRNVFIRSLQKMCTILDQPAIYVVR